MKSFVYIGASLAALALYSGWPVVQMSAPDPAAVGQHVDHAVDERVVSKGGDAESSPPSSQDAASGRPSAPGSSTQHRKEAVK